MVKRLNLSTAQEMDAWMTWMLKMTNGTSPVVQLFWPRASRHLVLSTPMGSWCINRAFRLKLDRYQMCPEMCPNVCYYRRHTGRLMILIYLKFGLLRSCGTFPQAQPPFMGKPFGIMTEGQKWQSNKCGWGPLHHEWRGPQLYKVVNPRTNHSK